MSKYRHDESELAGVWNKTGVFDILREKYQDVIETGIKWDSIDDCQFLGTVFSIMPSGKYYMPWCSNFTAKDALNDEVFREVLDDVAYKHGCYVFNGEGDPCDMFIAPLDYDPDNVD